MLLPILKELPTARDKVEVFKGYNHNLRIGDGEFFEMENMTSDDFPVLSPRGKRGLYASPEMTTGIIAKDQLCYTDGSRFVMGTERIEMGLSEEPKQLVSMGSYVIILPDKKYINTATPEDFGDIEASVKVTYEDGVYCEPCSVSGENYLDAVMSSEAPENPQNLDLWLDTSSGTPVRKRYSTNSGTWVVVTNNYVKISATGIGKGLRQYDGVTISGITDEKLTFLNGSHVLWGCSDDYLIVMGMLDKGYIHVRENQLGGSDKGMIITRTLPELDFVTEAGNRLWGCRYGLNSNGEMVNEIYASKLGDFRNWNCYMGTSTDSYTASCGTDGPFTGAITHGGRPLFFKENHLHKVYGSVPANFQIQAISCRGVQKGSHRSLAIVNETLFYKSMDCICAYDGAMPVEVSFALGGMRYSKAAAGSYGNKYYVSMADPQGDYHLFVYDTVKDMWHREDNFRGTAFCAFQGELYAIDADTGKILAMLGSGEAGEQKVKWMVQTGPLGTDSPDTKYISKLLIRMSLSLGSRVRFLAQYDSMGAWEHMGTMVGRNLRSFSIPVIPVRCDHLRLRIEGEGEAKIYSITRTIEQGSDIP